MLHELLAQYGKDATITGLVDSLDIFVVPVFNVDGYVYTYVDWLVWAQRTACRCYASRGQCGRQSASHLTCT